MTLGEIRDWLKTVFDAEHYYIGRLDGNREKTLGVYDRPRRGEPAAALGGPACASYGVRSVSLLLRWNRNAAETEAAARRLWDAAALGTDIDTPGGGHIQYVRPAVPAPVSVGAAEPDGVYEYVLELDIYYRR